MSTAYNEDATFKALQQGLSEDERAFGIGTWVYCSQHCRPHQTGWCTVSNSNKTPLIAKSANEAYIECARMGVYIYKGQAPIYKIEEPQYNVDSKLTHLE